MQRDRHRNVEIGDRELHRVTPGDVVERRHEKVLVHARLSVVVGLQEIGVSLAVGVVHFGDHASQRAVDREAPVDRQGVEHVAEDAVVGEHDDAVATPGLDAVSGEEPLDIRLDVGRRSRHRAAEMITGVEGGERP